MRSLPWGGHSAPLPYHLSVSHAPSHPADLRRRPAVAAIVRDWRRLTGGRAKPDAKRRTLVACSGGADSSALALALAAATPHLVIGHILHDLRPREEAEADARAAGELAARLNLPFRRASVGVRGGPGNTEAKARRARYAALDALAEEERCEFIAVGHHANDQAETVLMGLLRGSGPRGLSGARPMRELHHATVVRPMLGITRSQAQAICDAAGWSWREDLTNADPSLLRGAVRHGLLPAAERLRPGASLRIARAALLLGDAAGLIADRVEEVRASGRLRAGAHEWMREALRRERGIVLGELLRDLARSAGGLGLDAMGSRALDAPLRAIADDRVQPREFLLGPLTISVRARTVRVGLTGAPTCG